MTMAELWTSTLWPLIVMLALFSSVLPSAVPNTSVTAVAVVSSSPTVDPVD